MSTILVVDDMAIFREPLAAILRQNGYEVSCAADGRQALSQMDRTEPDLILLDVGMPIMDGLSLLRVLRNDPRRRQLPVILLTAVTERDYVIEAAKLGVRDYLLKSQFSLAEMLGRVKRYLDESPAGAGPAPREAMMEGAPRLGAAPPTPGPAVDNGTSPIPTVVPDESSTLAPSRAPPARQSSPPVSQPRPRFAPAVVPADLEPLINQKELLGVIADALELRPLAPVVFDVMAATGNSACTAGDIAKAISHDQALAIRIMKLANSSAYARGRPVDNVKAAVQRVGTQEIRNLVATLGAMGRFEGRGCEHLDAHLFWEHSIACGLVASGIAKARGLKSQNDCFLWGLLHDVGRLIFLDHFPEQYSAVLAAAREHGLALETVEDKMMTADHCHVLEMALKHWKFSPEFIEPVVSHHQSPGKIKHMGPDRFEGAAAVALADRIAHALALGSSGNEMVYPWKEFAGLLGLEGAAIAQLIEDVPLETNELKSMMVARGSAENWPDAASQIRERFHTPMRPLCVSDDPHIDAVRAFCQRVADPFEGAPNIGVIHLRDVPQQPSLVREFTIREEQTGAGPLPVIVVHDKGQINADDAWLKARPRAILKMPLGIGTFVAAVNDLLDPK